MAYQPKSYRKFLTTSVAAAVVATVAVPAVSPVAAAGANFTDISGVQSWAGDAISYLVEKGAIEGVGGNKFNPNGQLTRGQAAKILALTLELDVDLDSKTDFSDAANHWASPYIAAIQEQAEGVINGYTDGTFKPEGTITRQEMAKMVVEAYGLEANDNNPMNFSDNNGWGAEYISTLASLGIANGKGAGKFQPNGNVTRAEAVVFVHRTEVPAVRIAPSLSELVKNVSALDREGKFFEVSFNFPVSSLDASQIRVADAKTGSLRGVANVKLAANGLSAQVEMLGDYDAGNGGAWLQALRTYNVTVTIPGHTSTFAFERPAALEEAMVTSYSVTNKTINVGGKALKVDADFDYEGHLGERWTVFYNSNNELVKIISETETSYIDAIELVVHKGEVKVELESTGEKLEFALDKDDDYAVAFQGQLRSTDDEADLRELIDDKENKFNYAKVVLDKNGKVEFIKAIDLDKVVLFDSLDGDVIVGAGEEEVDFEDFVVVKDGSTIELEDIEEGDLVFYNASEEYAEVYSNSVTGEIEDIFTDRITVDGKDYKYSDGKDTLYIDKDGKVAKLVPDNNEDDDTIDALEAMQEEGEVTLYFDRAGKLLFISGDVSKQETTSTYVFVYDVKLDYDNRGKKYHALDIIDAKGKKVAYDFAVSDFTGNNPDIDGKDVIESLGKGDIVKISINNDGEVKKLAFAEGGRTGVKITKNDKVELEKDFFKGFRLKSDTVIYTIDDSENADTVDSVDDVTPVFLDDATFEEITEGYAFVNDKGQVVAIIAENTDVADTEKLQAVVLDKPTKVAGDDIARITLYVPGEGKTVVYTREEKGVMNDVLKLKKHDLVEFEVSKGNGNIRNVVSTAGLVTGGLVYDVSTVNNTIQLVDGKGEKFRLAPDAVVLNKDLKEISLSTLKEGKDKVNVIRIEKGSSYVQFVVLTDNPVTGDNPGTDPGEGPGEDLTFADANGTVQQVVPGVFNLFVDADEVDVPEGQVLQLDIDGDLITFVYEADENRWAVYGVQGHTQAEIEAGDIVFETEDEDGDNEGEEPTTVSFTAVNGSVEQVVPGVYNVFVSKADAEAEGFVTGADKSLTLKVDGTDAAELTFETEQSRFAGYAIQGFTQAQLQGSTVAQ